MCFRYASIASRSPTYYKSKGTIINMVPERWGPQIYTKRMSCAAVSGGTRTTRGPPSGLMSCLATQVVLHGRVPREGLLNDLIGNAMRDVPESTDTVARPVLPVQHGRHRHINGEMQPPLSRARPRHPGTNDSATHSDRTTIHLPGQTSSSLGSRVYHASWFHEPWSSRGVASIQPGIGWP